MTPIPILNRLKNVLKSCSQNRCTKCPLKNAKDCFKIQIEIIDQIKELLIKDGYPNKEPRNRKIYGPDW